VPFTASPVRALVVPRPSGTHWRQLRNGTSHSGSLSGDVLPCSGSPEEPYQVLADNNMRPWCVHRLRCQAARTIMAEHQRQWRNGRTSTGRYSVALRSTEEQMISPPLNQRVRGSSPWRRTPSDLRILQGTASNHPRRPTLVYPSCVHRSATGLTTLASARPDTPESTPEPLLRHRRGLRRRRAPSSR